MKHLNLFFKGKEWRGSGHSNVNDDSRAFHRNKGNLCGFGLFIKQA